ncbi:MAG: radical SAM protein [Deltaproteobacteria bacterium]|nr:radical SAM protein [Deltaproteobacteria bacterium]
MDSLILINPWIYDFAAHDLWSKPLGLLYIAGYLRGLGLNVHVIDCMDKNNPDMLNSFSAKKPVVKRYGTGKYYMEEIEKPSALKHVQRKYSRYGIHPDIFRILLTSIEKPSAILVTSLMTYWYPGVIDSIRIVKEIHPGVPVILGGIYARLCPDHARNFSGADNVASEINLDNISSLPDILASFNISVETRHALSLRGASAFYPAFDTYNKIDYITIQTSTGCPYKCKYCASRFLYPVFKRRDPDDVVSEIIHWHTGYNVIDFAFYDDALLIDSERHIVPILDKLKTNNIRVRFHTPNALHVKEITSDIARLLFSSGFTTIRLGLETSDMDMHRELDKKIALGDFETAVRNLREAGFTKKDIGAYILMGLPGQSVESVTETVMFADKAGAMPYLAEYSPLPETPLWEPSVACARFDLKSDPIFQNNSLLSCWNDDQLKKLPELKAVVKKIREA